MSGGAYVVTLAIVYGVLSFYCLVADRREERENAET